MSNFKFNNTPSRPVTDRNVFNAIIIHGKHTSYFNNNIIIQTTSIPKTKRATSDGKNVSLSMADAYCLQT